MAKKKAKAEKSTYDRVEEGRAWLAAHDADPPGRNYMWWKSGIQPTATMGKHVTQETKDSYVKWHKAFTMWLRLYAQLETESGDEARDWAVELQS